MRFVWSVSLSYIFFFLHKETNAGSSNNVNDNNSTFDLQQRYLEQRMRAAAEELSGARGGGGVRMQRRINNVTPLILDQGDGTAMDIGNCA